MGTVFYKTNKDTNLSNLQSFIASLPKDSIERLRHINLSTGSPRHIILTLAYGIYDRHIGRLNKMITGLLISRLKAERAGKIRLVNRINDFLENMHEAIDLVTDTGDKRSRDGFACKTAKLAS